MVQNLSFRKIIFVYNTTIKMISTELLFLCLQVLNLMIKSNRTDKSSLIWMCGGKPSYGKCAVTFPAPMCPRWNEAVA